jgi:hypothetical protein
MVCPKTWTWKLILSKDLYKDIARNKANRRLSTDMGTTGWLPDSTLNPWYPLATDKGPLAAGLPDVLSF